MAMRALAHEETRTPAFLLRLRRHH